MSTFVGHFCPPGSGSGFRFRIRIHWPDWIRIRNPAWRGTPGGRSRSRSPHPPARTQQKKTQKLINRFIRMVKSLRKIATSATERSNGTVLRPARFILDSVRDWCRDAYPELRVRNWCVRWAYGSGTDAHAERTAYALSTFAYAQLAHHKLNEAFYFSFFSPKN